MLMASVMAACGSDTIEADPTVAAFVGTWDADSLTMTNAGDTTVVANLLDFGSFVILIEPSGQYTATLTVLGSTGVEFGDLDANAATSTIQLNRSAPPPPAVSTSSYSFVADDYLVLDGASEFDFNLDQIPEAAQAHFELRRR